MQRRHLLGLAATDLASYPPPAPLVGAAFAGYIADYVKEWTGVAKAAGIVAG